MKKLLAKLRCKSFWVTLSGALTLILSRLGVADASALANGIVQTVGSILLLCGVVTLPLPAPSTGQGQADESAPDGQTEQSKSEEDKKEDIR